MQLQRIPFFIQFRVTEFRTQRKKILKTFKESSWLSSAGFLNDFAPCIVRKQGVAAGFWTTAQQLRFTVTAYCEYLTHL